MRVFWLFNHPAPYKVEFFNRLGKLCDLTVYFERVTEGGRNATFYAKKAESFHAYFGHPLILGSMNNYTREPIKFLKQHEQYDIIVLNGWRTVTERIAISYCKRHRIPYIFAINGGIAKKHENNLSFVIKQTYISGAPVYLAPDGISKEYLIHYGAEPNRIALYPYGSVSEEELLDKPYDEKAIRTLRERLNIQGERVYVSTGFFIKRKNLDALIRQWRRMNPDYHLYLIGQGPERKSYLRLIKQLKLFNVHLLPYMDHEALFRFYRACDGFLFPTHYDIYGHVVTEAMSQGLPVYASEFANASKELINGNNGRILDFHNEAEVVMELNKPLNPSMEEEAIKTASRYTYEASAKAHADFFAKLITGKNNDA